MSDKMPEWMKSNKAMRAEIDRQLIFAWQLTIDIEAAIDDEFIVQGTGESKWPSAAP